MNRESVVTFDENKCDKQQKQMRPITVCDELDELVRRVNALTDRHAKLTDAVSHRFDELQVKHDELVHKVSSRHTKLIQEVADVFEQRESRYQSLRRSVQEAGFLIVCTHVALGGILLMSYQFI